MGARYNHSMILDLPYVLETRRNHALEHATLHMLATKYSNRSMAGHSNPTGFFILGDFPTDDIAWAANEALTRLRAGESKLAIHAGCGTNLATAVLLSGTLAWFVLRGAKSTFGRVIRAPFAVVFALFGLILSQPLGPVLQQRITTEAQLGDLKIIEVRQSMRGRITVNRVITK
jgi:hypothetical protein